MTDFGRKDCPCNVCLVKGCCNASYPSPEEWKKIEDIPDEYKHLWSEGNEEFVIYQHNLIKDVWDEKCVLTDEELKCISDNEKCPYINEWMDDVIGGE